MEALGNPFSYPSCPSVLPLILLRALLISFPSSRPMMNIPYWGCDSKSLPRNPQISQWPQTSLGIPNLSIRGTMV